MSEEIRGTSAQWMELMRWLANSKRPQYCKHLYDIGGYMNLAGPLAVRPIMRSDTRTDRWLWHNCPLPWIKAELREMYQGNPFAPGSAVKLPGLDAA
jgi:hypothetical protein